MAPSRAALGRLPTYLSHIRKLQAAGETSTSATAIAKALGMGEVQVRKDLSAVSGTGKPKTGYLVSDLADALEKHLGCHHKTLAVLVGAGELGRALLNYGGFADYGAEIAAAFDIDPARTTPAANGKPVIRWSVWRNSCAKRPSRSALSPSRQGRRRRSATGWSHPGYAQSGPSRRRSCKRRRT